MALSTLIVYLIWFLVEISVNRFMRSKNKGDKKDKGSLALIWVVIAVSITASVLISMNTVFPVSSGKTAVYCGLALLLFGIFMRIIVIWSLGNSFTADVAISNGQTLKKDGFYKYLRHPSYFASLLSFVGFGLTLNNWISLAVVTVAIFGAFAYRINVEEKALVDYFGNGYVAYKKQTKAIIPFVY